MGDSDDEYDRKRRDKFRGERSAGGGDSYGRNADRPDRSRGRDEWSERARPRQDYRDYRPPPRDRGYSPAREAPPVKRMRGESWADEGRHRFGGHDGYGMYSYPHEHFGLHPGSGSYGHQAPQHQRDAPSSVDTQTQPCMMTLKQFLATQDDSISDSDAIAKYNEYKLEFRRQQLNEFFVAHKDEEWFKIKYHPEEFQKRKEEQLTFLKHRCEVFLELLKANDINKISVDASNSDALLRLLDTVVIKLEGGTDEDLKVLDEKLVASEAPRLPVASSIDKSKVEYSAMALSGGISVPNETTDFKPEDDSCVKQESLNENECKTNDGLANRAGENENTTDHLENIKCSDDDKRENNMTGENNIFELDGNDVKMEHKQEDGNSEDERKKRIRTDSASSSSTSSSSSSGESDDSNKELNDNADKANKKDVANKQDTTSLCNNTADTLKPDNPEAIVEHNADRNEDTSMGDDACKTEENCNMKGNENAVKLEEIETHRDVINVHNPETIDLVKDAPTDAIPRALHRTSSIFLRNLAPSITKAEVEAMCRRYNGFLRVAIADPLLERRWFRRGWVTFQRDVNIKEICWNLNNIRLRDCELGAIVNKDLSRRVRPVNGITCHKTVVRSDIKLGARIAHNLDDKWGLWKDDWIQSKVLDDENGSSAQPEQSFGLLSKNPVLQNITDYLIEEASAEEEELLGVTDDTKKGSEGENIERDPQLIDVLDKLILYLRIVHSVDFYNHCEYPYEDEMPNRCGIIHARGPPPQSKITSNEIHEYIRTFEGKMTSFLTKVANLDESEMKKLGCKDAEAEVEKFITANTQELAKDKWLCPLSGKKFKGPDFVRKHIFNKHAEKVEEVRKEVEYFNNYLKDAKRPQLPEHPGNMKKPGQESGLSSTSTGSGSGYRNQPFGMAPSYAPLYAPYPAGPIIPTNLRGRPPYGRGGRLGGPDFRPVIHYRDLDAPREPDEFL